jgi:hypothetical protein
MIMIVIIALSVPLLAVASYFLFNFLSNSLVEYLFVNRPLAKADVLIVEAWVFQFNNVVTSVEKEFKTGNYKYLLISGRSQGEGSPAFNQNSPTSSADGLSRALMLLGIDSSQIKIVEIPSRAKTHRTFSMARAAGKWLRGNDPMVKNVNVCTAGIHGKKSWWTYKRTLGKGYNVGILSFSSSTARPCKWRVRRCSSGWIVYNFVGYIYARFLPLSLIPDEANTVNAGIAAP